MDTTITKNQKNTAMLTHLSAFSKYFFPFGNIIIPLIVWSSKKEDAFIEHHGRQAVNFQLSLLLYSIALGMLCIPFFIFNLGDSIWRSNHFQYNINRLHFDTFNSFLDFSGPFILFGFLGFGLFIFGLYCVISAAIKASEGKMYHYPLSISFIKSSIKTNK